MHNFLLFVLERKRKHCQKKTKKYLIKRGEDIACSTCSQRLFLLTKVASFTYQYHKIIHTIYSYE